jgi:hypothetical protein
MDYLICDCERCKNGIEFPAHGLGRRISCPHCGAPVTLKQSPQPAVGIVSAKADIKPVSVKPTAPASKPPSETKGEATKPSDQKQVAPVADFEEKARKWREERNQWLLAEAQASLKLITESKMEKTAARKLRDLFVEISDEFERKATEDVEKKK